MCNLKQKAAFKRENEKRINKLKTMTKTKTLETLLSEHKISEEKKAKQRWETFFADIKKGEEFIKDNYTVYKKC